MALLLLGFVASTTISGFIHILLAAAIALSLVRILGGTLGSLPDQPPLVKA